MSFPTLAFTVNRINQWFVYSFALFLFCFPNEYSSYFGFFFARVNAIRMDDLRCCGILRDKRPPKRQIDREREDAEVDDLKTALP